MKYLYGLPDKIIKVKVKELDKVRDIMEKIQLQEGISSKNKVLKFYGKTLEKSRILLSYYNIKDESILYLEGKRENLTLNVKLGYLASLYIV